MTRFVRIPAEHPDREIDWTLVTNIHYVAEGVRRCARLTYRNGSHIDVPLTRAPDLYEQVKDVRGCPFPCYYRRETDAAPTDPACKDCRLLEVLVGADYDPRPAPLRLPAPKRERIERWLIAVLCLALWLAIWGLAATGQKRAAEHETPRKGKHVVPN